MSKILTTITDGIYHIKLNNPDKRNALDVELMTELTSQLNRLKEDLVDLKVILISGEGLSFCAGADLNWMKEMVNYSLEENIKDSHVLYDLFYAIYSFPLPVVVQAHGHVFGGGLGILAAADFVCADKDTKFCFSEVKLGLAPAVISSFVLSKCNPSHAQSLMTSGLVFNTHTAFHTGLVNVGADKFKEVLESYSQSGQEALIETKKLCLEQRQIKPETFKELTVKTISQLRIGAEAQKRMKNFLERKQK